jgi:peptidoglycan/xylan/chitin deacetylase (PgdA/CDA1 family)/protein-L-isoaspartate O-methyltransferase
VSATPPLVSVVVPAYNRRETLATSLDSLQAQTHGTWEAIVVDDGSTDGTAELAEAYAARDARIRVHRQANGGVSHARNAGLALARGPWLFFLDADDWILPETFELMLAAHGRDPRAEAIYGGYVRVDDDGRELRRELPEHEDDVFPLFARTCAVAVHACLVRTELVRRAGGFDESLITCEDWDLWQRIARLGARFARIPDFVAFYRVRVGSASGAGWRMLEDGLLVIDRGHGVDRRLDGQELPARRSLPAAARDVARTYFACFTAGLEIAAGRDPLPMIAALGEGISGDVDPGGVAETLFHAIPVGLATDVGAWATFPPETHRRCREFVDALGERVGNRWLAFGAHAELERLLIAEGGEERPRKAGRWYVMDLDLDGPPLRDLAPEPGVERILCGVRFGEERLGDVEVPVVDGWMPARVLADAIVAAHAWDLLRAFLERHVHPALEIERDGRRARVARGGRTLFDGELDPARTPREGLHDRIGWILFLQELWEAPELGEEGFYDGEVDGGDGARRQRAVLGRRAGVEIGEPLPTLWTARRRLDVSVAVAGAPVAVVRCETPRGGISLARLRRTLLVEAGWELCRAVLREAIVLGPGGEAGTLHARLAAGGAGERPAEAQATVGRRDPWARARWSALPAAIAEQRLALAHRDGDPIASAGGGRPARQLAAPTRGDGAGARRPRSERSLLRSLSFDEIFAARADPWRYDSAYEQRKYEQTLALLPARCERALELGCAEGVFTSALAERVGTLVAADVSRLALARAGRRCAGRPNVRFRQLDALEDDLGGPYDLIVCSELLYYAESWEQLAAVAKALAGALVPGGALVAAHAHALADEADRAGFDWDVPFGAASIEAALLGTRMLELREEVRTAPYRVQRFARRRTRRLLRPTNRHVRLHEGQAGAMHPRQAERYRPHGGAVRFEPPAPPAPTATRLPILMYHRIAPDGAAESRRWRLHPIEFEAQLRWLRQAGYRSLTLDQWRAACDRRLPIPERSVLLTFDDGYADFPAYALPLLQRYGFLATMFVVTDLVGATNVWDEQLRDDVPLMDWPALATLPAQGVELGSHSSAHRALVTLSAEQLARDLCTSRERLHERLGLPVRSVCYPYGLYDVGVLSAARACGFDVGVTTDEWHATFEDDPLALPRLEVLGTDTLEDFVTKLTAT